MLSLYILYSKIAYMYAVILPLFCCRHFCFLVRSLQLPPVAVWLASKNKELNLIELFIPILVGTFGRKLPVGKLLGEWKSNNEMELRNRFPKYVVPLHSSRFQWAPVVLSSFNENSARLEYLSNSNNTDKNNRQNLQHLLNYGWILFVIC